MSVDVVGTTINERYQIESELGQGGMGTVYRARDTTLDRDVAIKLISDTNLGQEGHERLLSEAKTVAQLDHPNIVTVFDAGEYEGSPYIVMQLVEGGTLHEQRPDSLEEKLQIVLQVCAALDHAHQHGIIHRDLKPENVALAPNGMAMLMDFGLARSVTSRMTTEGNIVGTVFYMAPEQAMGQEIDARADLYALGVMLYELATGELPFEDDNPMAVISQHINAPVVPPRGKNEDLPPYLDNLILKLLAKDPNDRPPGASDVFKILESPDESDDSLLVRGEISVLDRIVRGRFVGRKAEYEEARSLWQAVVAGEGHTVLISGEPGIGKTRLVREVVTQTEVSGGRALVGEAYEESNIPYGAFAQIVRRALDKSAQNGFELPDHVLDDALKLAPDLRPHYPNVEPNPELDAESEQARLLENMVALFEAISTTTPLLVVLDDAHWADSSSIALFLHLARRTRRQPVMLLATYREVELRGARSLNEMLVELNRQRIGTRIKLARLDEDQTRDMLAAILDDEITPEFLDGIYRETDGNPFFIEEVCRALVESGGLYFADGEWHRPDIAELEIPQGIQVAVESRLTKLPDHVQDTLRLAAVLGREFDYEVLVEASDLDEDTLIDAIEIADKAQMVQEGREDTLFEFVHALVPQSIRENTHRLRLRKLHQRSASAYEAVQPDNYESLAYHHSEGGNGKEAFHYFTLAAQRAMENFANQDAEILLLNAIDLAADSQTRAELYEFLGTVLDRLDRNDEAVKAYREGIALSLELEELDDAAKLFALAARSSSSGSLADALELALEGLQATERLQEGPGLSHLLERAAAAYIYGGQTEEGLPLADKSLEMADKLNIPAVQVEVLNTLSTAIRREDHQKSVAFLRQAVELAEENNLWQEAIRTHANFAYIVGEDSRALQRKHFARAIELAKMMGLTSRELAIWRSSISWAVWMGDIGFGLQELPKIKERIKSAADPERQLGELGYIEGDILRFQGDLEAALPKYQQALRTYEKLESKLAVSNTIGATAWLLIESGQSDQLDNAYELLQRSLEIEPSQPIHLSLIALLLIKKGDYREARRIWEEAQKAYEDNPIAWDEYWVRLTEAQLLSATQEWDEAWIAFRRTIEVPVLNEYPWFRADTFRLWSGAHLVRGEAEDMAHAGEMLEKALSIFEDIGATGYVEAVETQIRDLPA